MCAPHLAPVHNLKNKNGYKNDYIQGQEKVSVEKSKFKNKMST
jgi:hypothetical protein